MGRGHSHGRDHGHGRDRALLPWPRRCHLL